MDCVALEKYNIYISDGDPSVPLRNFLEANHYDDVIVLTDTNTKQHCLPLIIPALDDFIDISISAGEQFKNIQTCDDIWDRLASGQITRNALMINLGGGVIGDVGGFIAGTFKRGIDFINIPTTLLSQVDASVGGKTGIDHNHAKNMIGLFNNPKEIIICTTFLKSLPKRQLKSGFAEMLKHGLIADKNYWNEIKIINPLNYENWQQLVRRSVEIKKMVVEADPFEKGLRKTLNFGHTVGHALETISLTHDEDPLFHGEAIAIGMICEAWLSNKKNQLSDESMKEIEIYIQQTFPKRKLHQPRADDFLNIVRMDKKNSKNTIHASLLREIGHCDINCVVSEEEIIDSVAYFNSL